MFNLDNRKKFYQVVLLDNEIINRGKMITRDQQPIYSESRWQTVAELSLRGELGCEHEAAEKVTEILVSIHIPDRVLVESKQPASVRALTHSKSLPEFTCRIILGA